MYISVVSEAMRAFAKVVIFNSVHEKPAQKITNVPQFFPPHNAKSNIK